MDVYWVHLAQDREQYPVNPVMNFLVPQNAKNFVTSQASSNVLKDGLRSSDSISTI